MQLFAIDRGAGAPIVLLHGGLATHVACAPFADLLASRFRVVTPDLRASGASIYAGPITWDALADDIAELARDKGIERAIVGGISFGAGVAVRVALRHPALVGALAVIHPAFGGADVGLAPAQQVAMDAMAAAGRRGLADWPAAMYPLLDTLPPPIRVRARALVATYDPPSVAALTAFMASGAQPFERGAELATIAVPTIVVPGVDPQHPAELAEIYRRHIASCVVVPAVDPAGIAAAIATLA